MLSEGEERAPGDDPDGEAVRRVLDGDVEAFAGIVERWQGPLVNLAYRYCRDRGIAEEMAQEAFLLVFRKLSSWRGEARFSTWLFAVAANRYRSLMRRHRPPELSLDELRELRGADAAIDSVREESDESRAAGDLERSDVAEVVRRAVSNLPARYRDVMLVYYFREMDVAETAQILELKEGTVKARLHRGRNLLERKLRGLLPGGVAELAVERG